MTEEIHELRGEEVKLGDRIFIVNPWSYRDGREEFTATVTRFTAQQITAKDDDGAVYRVIKHSGAVMNTVFEAYKSEGDYRAADLASKCKTLINRLTNKPMPERLEIFLELHDYLKGKAK